MLRNTGYSSRLQVSDNKEYQFMLGVIVLQLGSVSREPRRFMEVSVESIESHQIDKYNKTRRCKPVAWCC